MLLAKQLAFGEIDREADAGHEARQRQCAIRAPVGIQEIFDELAGRAAGKWDAGKRSMELAGPEPGVELQSELVGRRNRQEHRLAEAEGPRFLPRRSDGK